MTDNQLFALIGAQLTACLAAQGWTATILQKDQPTLQGIPSGNVVFMEKIFDHPYGTAGTAYAYESASNTFNDTETQVYESTFQISTLWPQDPSNDAIPTASDVLNMLKMWLTGGPTIRALIAGGASLLKVSQVRNPAFQDDKDQQEFHPSFDVVMVHNSAVTFSVGAANTFNANKGTVPI